MASNGRSPSTAVGDPIGKIRRTSEVLFSGALSSSATVVKTGVREGCYGAGQGSAWHVMPCDDGFANAQSASVGFYRPFFYDEWMSLRRSEAKALNGPQKSEVNPYGCSAAKKGWVIPKW